MKRSLRIAASAALITTFAAPALACPTGADMQAKGIAISFDDDSRSVYTIGANNVIRQDVMLDGGQDGFWFEAIHSLYVFAYGGLTNGAPDTATNGFFGYTASLGSLPAPSPDLRWTDYVEIQNGKREGIGKSDISIGLGKPTPIKVAGCDYEGLRAEVLISFPGGTEVNYMDYIPALGIAVITAQGTTNDGMTDIKSLTIEAVK